MPKVSVLLTSYNHVDFLPQAVESLRRQTFQDFEVLALDDGSRDGSREWLLEQSDLRCFFHEKNLGTYGNLNFGLDHAVGEYIAVFNDDDYWASDKLAKQVEVLDSDANVGLVHTSGWFVGPQGERIEGEPLGFPWPEGRSGFVLPDLIYKNRVIASSAMFRRSWTQEIGQFDPEFWGCGDWHMWLRFSERGPVGYLDEPLTFYRVHPDQACRDEEKMTADSLRIREWLESRRGELNEKYSGDSDLEQALIHNLACVGTERMWLGDRRGGRRAYWESLKLNPLRWKSALRLGASFLPAKTFRSLR